MDRLGRPCRRKPRRNGAIPPVRRSQTVRIGRRHKPRPPNEGSIHRMTRTTDQQPTANAQIQLPSKGKRQRLNGKTVPFDPFDFAPFDKLPSSVERFVSSVPQASVAHVCYAFNRTTRPHQYPTLRSVMSTAYMVRCPAPQILLIQRTASDAITVKTPRWSQAQRHLENPS
jgi:hypothetical protein